MSIGGVDIVLRAAPNIAAVETIARICQRHWPQALIQDANETLTTPLINGAACSECNEFFIYQDESAASSWLDNGAVPENRNTMLHFLINDVNEHGVAEREVTVVCDGVFGQVESIINDLKTALLDCSPWALHP